MSNPLIIYECDINYMNHIYPYVGKTGRGLEKRKKEHYRDAKNRAYLSAFHEMLLLVPKSAVTWTILDNTATDMDQLADLEVKYIALKNSYKGNNKYGLNLTLGGEGGTKYHFTKEQLLKDLKECRSIKGICRKYGYDDNTISKRLQAININPTDIMRQHRSEDDGTRCALINDNDDILIEFLSVGEAARYIEQKLGLVNVDSKQHHNIASGIRKIFNPTSRSKAYKGYKFKKIES